MNDEEIFAIENGSFKNAQINSVLLSNSQQRPYFVATPNFLDSKQEAIDAQWKSISFDTIFGLRNPTKHKIHNPDDDYYTIGYVVFPNTHAVEGGRVVRV